MASRIEDASPRRALAAADLTTVDDGFDTAPEGDARWTTAGIVEMLPGVLPPLVWEVNRLLVEEAFRQLFDQLRVLPGDIDDRGGFLGRFRGRVALSLEIVEAMARAMPGGSEADVEQQYFGVAAGGADTAQKAPRRGVRGLVHDLLVARERREATVEAETVIEAWATVAEEPVAVEGLDDDELLAYRRRLLDLGGRTMAAELAVAAAAVAAYRRLELTLLKRLDAKEVATWAPRLTPGSRRPPAPGEAGSGASRSIFAGPTWAEAGDVPRLAPPPPASADAPEVAARDQAWEELIVRLRNAPNWSTVRAMTGQVADVRLIVLRRLVEDANDLLARREAAKAALLALGGEVRRVHLELGRRLAVRGALARATDVDLLGEKELGGARPMPSLAELERRRRWLDARASEPLLPQRFRGVPVVVEGDRSELGPVLHGWPAGPGRHTGRARVLDEPDPSRLDPGDVLVARATDAAWTPVLMRAGAIVVEEGGPLSHAAIVARELGVPAVLNVPGITDLLGERRCTVTVDGNEGVVEVLDRDGDDGDG